MAFLDYQAFKVNQDLSIQTFSYQMPIFNLPYIYNVSYAVGPNCPNQREDVELVQTLLQFTSRVFPLAPGGLVVDGLFGPITAACIANFQRFGPFMAQDGRVDRARGTLGSVSGRFYTIAWLNGFAKQARPDLYGDPKVLATDMPSIIWQLRQKCGVFMALNAMAAITGQ
jgi:peptidoglycan hydrolase-like protein with peptidoglycan-binding domain